MTPRRAAAFATAAFGVLGLGVPFVFFVAHALPQAGHDALIWLWLFSVLFGLWYIPARLWGRDRIGANAGLLLASTAAAWCALVLAVFANYLIRINSNLCGASHHVHLVAGAPALATYLAVGGTGIFRRRKLLFLWPLAVAAGATVYLVLTAVLPGGHGFCET